MSKNKRLTALIKVLRFLVFNNNFFKKDEQLCVINGGGNYK